MIKQLREEMGLRFRDEKRRREPLPEGPKGFMVPKEMGGKEMPGYWADVNGNNKVNMNGDVVPATLEERLQRALRRF